MLQQFPLPESDQLSVCHLCLNVTLWEPNEQRHSHTPVRSPAHTYTPAVNILLLLRQL